MSYALDIVVPATESAAGFGTYPRVLASRIVQTMGEARKVMSINKLTWLDALHDHETRYEAWVRRPDGEAVLYREYPRDAEKRAPALGKTALREMRARPKAILNGVNHHAPVRRVEGN